MSPLFARGRRILVSGLVAGGVVVGMVLAPAPAQAAPVKNLIANGSVESVVRQVPKGWTKGGSGANTRVLSVPSGGAASGKRFARTQITKYRNGAAGWVTPVALVRAGNSYTFAESYRSNRPTKVNAYFTVGKRTVGRQLGALPASSKWRTVRVTFTAPSGASKVRFATTLSSVGVVDVDSLSLVGARTSPKPGGNKPPVPGASGRGLISVTLDDGWTNQYTNAFPIMKANNIPGTFYLISSYMGSGAYMSTEQAKQIQAAGSELGSHTQTHAKLTTLDSTALRNELANSKRSLEAKFGTGSITSLAYPFGSSNATVQAEVANHYSNARSTNPGLMAKGKYNRYSLTIGYVLNTTPQSTVQGWINDAKANNTWLVLCYHRVANDQPTDPYTVSVSAFQNQMGAIKASGVPVVTVRDGVSRTS